MRRLPRGWSLRVAEEVLTLATAREIDPALAQGLAALAARIHPDEAVKLLTDTLTRAKVSGSSSRNSRMKGDGMGKMEEPRDVTVILLSALASIAAKTETTQAAPMHLSAL